MNKQELKLVLDFIIATKKGLPLPDISELVMSNKLYPKLYKKILNKYEKETKTYMYMITFTCDPKKVNIDCSIELDHVEKFILKTLKRKGLRILKADYVREGTDKDHKHAHWHVGLITKACLKEQYFTTYISTYGNIDISKSVENNYEDIKTYINKTHESVSYINKTHKSCKKMVKKDPPSPIT